MISLHCFAIVYYQRVNLAVEVCEKEEDVVVLTGVLAKKAATSTQLVVFTGAVIYRLYRRQVSVGLVQLVSPELGLV